MDSLPSHPVIQVLSNYTISNLPLNDMNLICAARHDPNNNNIMIRDIFLQLTPIQEPFGSAARLAEETIMITAISDCRQLYAHVMK